MAKNTHEDQKTLAIITHLLPFLTGFIGPLVMLLAVEDDEVKKHAKTALNWAFSEMIYYAVGAILLLIFVGILVLIAVGVLGTVFRIIAAIRASEGKVYHYPMSIPFFKI